jgi:hypothetical protein
MKLDWKRTSRANTPTHIEVRKTADGRYPVVLRAGEVASVPRRGADLVRLFRRVPAQGTR